MSINLPVIPSAYSARYLIELHKRLVQLFTARPDVTQPRSELLLVSPGGVVYSVAVDDAGTLSATLVDKQ